MTDTVDCRISSSLEQRRYALHGFPPRNVDIGKTCDQRCSVAPVGDQISRKYGLLMLADRSVTVDCHGASRLYVFCGSKHTLLLIIQRFSRHRPPWLQDTGSILH
jgi:hypothetical protein